ncbi:hypothetical protein H4S04_003815 [Coemansia sp. S16]|nr:hypothetical protein H4S04_003815 [Coemansia sp. S16]KAJ2068741.1 hypothetical protein GGI08_000712 [Coemansia sp. S2]KAJ2347912.1 hypothetical protein GGH92_003016 [Coemansia sp. RSA 2673]
MAINRYRVYDIVQRSLSTVLFGTTFIGGAFIGVNVYQNYVQKQKLQKEASLLADKIAQRNSES